MTHSSRYNLQRLKATRLTMIASAVLGAAVLVDRLPKAYGLGSVLGKFSGTMLLHLLPVALLTGLAILAVWLSYSAGRARMMAWGSGVSVRPLWVRAAAWAAFALLAAVYPLVQLAQYGPQVDIYFPRLWLFGHLVLLGGVLVNAASRKLSFSLSLAAALLIYSLVYQAALYIPAVSNYPLSLGWSEANRYYNASLFFAKQVYGEWAPLPILHPTRYLMQSIPFTIPALPIWFHRLWQVLLWAVLTGLGGAALARRVQPGSRFLGFLLAAWAFLFAMQGPVYYHLMSCAVIVLFGFDRSRFWRSTFVVLAASVWAGMSRVNWFPVPGMLAAALYVLETPEQGKSFIRYWASPVIWVVVGTAVAVGSQAAYMALSGNPPEQFGSSFSSPLLWYRLFPNEAYGPGILRLALVASLPPLALIVTKVMARPKAWQPLRPLSLAAMLLVLFGGGVVVSAKIGGGNNLHNLDAYLVLLMAVAAYLAFDRFVSDRDIPLTPKADQVNRRLASVAIAASLLVPAFTLARTGEPVTMPDPVPAQASIASLQAVLDEAGGKEVLFISHRHLLTFHEIKGVKLVQEYEKVFLMEMAMSNNEPYLSQFQNDLKNHRFAYIVTEPPADVIQDESALFGEENNAWVIAVTRPMLQNYQEKATFEGSITVMEPKP